MTWHFVNPLVPLALAVVIVSPLTGCAVTPTGPTVSVMPSSHKSLAAFEDDDVICKHYASGQVEGDAAHANWLQAAVAGGGTLLGAGLGAAIGGGKGAAIGAAGGALGGTAIGGFRAKGGQQTIQDRYDVAYAQCQRTRGNRRASVE